MSEDKIISKHIYTSNGGYCVYYPSNIFHNKRGFENWGISLGYSQFQLGNIQSRDAFRPTACEQKYLMDNNYNYLGKTGFFLAERKFLMSCPPT